MKLQVLEDIVRTCANEVASRESLRARSSLSGIGSDKDEEGARYSLWSPWVSTMLDMASTRHTIVDGPCYAKWEFYFTTVQKSYVDLEEVLPSK